MNEKQWARRKYMEEYHQKNKKKIREKRREYFKEYYQKHKNDKTKQEVKNE